MNWQKGSQLNTIQKPPFTREQLAAYAVASGDPNKIHLDETFAKEAGFPSVIVHGMLSMAYLADLVMNNFPQDKFHLVRFKSRFRKVTFPGDALTLEGEVKALLPDGTIQVSLRAKNQAGEVKIDGDADVKPRS